MTTLHRRQLLKGLAAAGLLSQLSPMTAWADNRPLYIDGLSFLPEDLADLKASKLSAYLCDISAIEAIEQSDGTTNYKRTYKACVQSIGEALARVNDNPDKLLLGKTGADIKLAHDSGRTSVFFQIQGADCLEKKVEEGVIESIDTDLNQVDEFYQRGLRVLQLTHHYGNKFSGGALDNDGKQGLNLPLTESPLIS